MAEVYFYHLQRQGLEAVLPRLLARSVERGWRAVIRVTSEERLAQLDDHLWTYSDESFLAHGTDRDPDPAEHPILLTLGEGNRNAADILFLAEGAQPPDDLSPYRRVALIFEGRDEDAVADARQVWARLRGAGHAVSYWQEDEAGRWQARA